MGSKSSKSDSAHQSRFVERRDELVRETLALRAAVATSTPAEATSATTAAPTASRAAAADGGGGGDSSQPAAVNRLPKELVALIIQYCGRSTATMYLTGRDKRPSESASASASVSLYRWRCDERGFEPVPVFLTPDHSTTTTGSSGGGDSKSASATAAGSTSLDVWAIYPHASGGGGSASVAPPALYGVSPPRVPGSGRSTVYKIELPTATAAAAAAAASPAVHAAHAMASLCCDLPAGFCGGGGGDGYGWQFEPPHTGVLNGRIVGLDPSSKSVYSASIFGRDKSWRWETVDCFVGAALTLWRRDSAAYTILYTSANTFECVDASSWHSPVSLSTHQPYAHPSVAAALKARTDSNPNEFVLLCSTDARNAHFPKFLHRPPAVGDDGVDRTQKLVHFRTGASAGVRVALCVVNDVLFLWGVPLYGLHTSGDGDGAAAAGGAHALFALPLLTAVPNYKAGVLSLTRCALPPSSAAGSSAVASGDGRTLVPSENENGLYVIGGGQATLWYDITANAWTCFDAVVDGVNRSAVVLPDPLCSF